jgi:ribosomal protein L7/L12
MSHLGVSGSEPPEPSASVRALITDGSTNVAAIKAYRAETGLGLVEAKEAIDRIVSLRSRENV